MTDHPSEHLLHPDSVARHTFTTARKGYETGEVRAFLHSLSAELRRLQDQMLHLNAAVAEAERRAARPSQLDESTVSELLGEEAARVLVTAREGAAQMRQRAEEHVGRLLRDAQSEATRLRSDAELDAARRRERAEAAAEAELDAAKARGREMIGEAQAVRERILEDLTRRRNAGRAQLEQIKVSRDRLLAAFEAVRLTYEQVVDELRNASPAAEAVAAPPVAVPVGAADVVALEPLVQSEALVRTPEAEAEPEPAPTAEVAAAPAAAAANGGSFALGEVPGASPPEEEPEPEADDLEPAAVEMDAETEPVAAAEPEAPSAVVEVDAPDDDVPPEPADGPSAPVGEDIPAESTHTAPSPHAVDDLFARIRASRAEAVAHAHEVLTPEGAPAGEQSEEQAWDAIADASQPAGQEDRHEDELAPAIGEPEGVGFAARAEVLDPITRQLARQLKRALADEQNEALDALRRQTGTLALEDLVGVSTHHAERYRAAAEDALWDAAIAGAGVGQDEADGASVVERAHVLDDVLTELDREVATPLREDLAGCIAEAAGDADGLAELARATYREWKTQRLEGLADHLALVAYGAGAYAAAPEGASLRWLVEPGAPKCPDADDNALAGVLTKGLPFPTGHQHAPAHPGCRCQVVVARQ